VRRVHAPPVVGKYVEDAQNHNEEDGGPLGFEANSNHTAGGKTEYGDKYPGNAPCTLKDEPEEQEDEENTAGEQEIFLAISFADRWESSKQLLSCDHRFAEDHNESANDAQIAEEKVEIEDEAVSKALDDDHAEETANSIFGEALRYDGAGSNKHSDHVQQQEQVRNAPWKVSVSLQIPDLVIPLGHDSQRILQESHNDQETTNGRQMGFQGLRVDFDIVFHSLAENSQFFNGVVGICGSVAS